MDPLKFPLPKIVIYYTTFAVGMLMAVHLMQNVFGIKPCDLCIYERYPYYILLFGAVLVPLHFEKFAFYMQNMALAVGVVISAYHSGIERGWWQGFSACSANNTKGLSIDEIIKMMENTPLVKCNEISFSLYGLSLANYNFFISLSLTLFGILYLWTHRKNTII